jgi:outer membrane protein
MKTIQFAATALSAVAALSLASGAAAQTAAASPYGLTGSAANICVVSSGSLLGDSAVGRSIDARMKQLLASVQAELSTEQNALETENKSLEAASKAATTAAAKSALQTRAQTFQTRYENFQRKGQLREAELRQTQAKAVARVGDTARPLIRQVANTKGCGLVLDSNAVADANPSMDITRQVIQQLDAKMPSMTFDREHLDTQGAAGAK